MGQKSITTKPIVTTCGVHNKETLSKYNQNIYMKFDWHVKFDS